jgi:predicted enzyme related to lactoylglutathione lyase
MIRQIATVAVYVEDQQRAKAFWTRQVGFEVRAEHTMDANATWLEVAPPGAQSGLVLYPKRMMPEWKGLKPSIVFKCDDVDETCTWLQAQGVTLTSLPKALPGGGFATFQDPDGNEFILRG